jgi:hypothetical protein
MHGIDQTQTFLYLAFLDCFFDLGSYINKFLPLFGIKPKVLGIGFHMKSIEKL